MSINELSSCSAVYKRWLFFHCISGFNFDLWFQWSVVFLCCCYNELFREQLFPLRMASFNTEVHCQSRSQRNLRFLHILNFCFNVICIVYVQDIKAVRWGQQRCAFHLLSGGKSGDETSSAIDGQSSAGTTSHLMSLVSNSTLSSLIVSACMSNCRGQSMTLWPALLQL